MILAADDTLPDNAGYVAAAYLVFLALVLIYVAIMAAKLARIERELRRAQRARRRPRDARGRAAEPRRPPAMSELLALGISHKTAPVALRERLALADAEAERFLRELPPDDEVHEAVAISTCNRTEIYLVAATRSQAEARRARRASPTAPASARPSSPTSSTRRATATPRASSSASRAAWSR